MKQIQMVFTTLLEDLNNNLILSSFLLHLLNFDAVFTADFPSTYTLQIASFPL